MARTPDLIKIEVQGLTYTCPKTPPKEEIRGSHLPKKDQVWYRRLEWEQWNWNQDPDEGEIWFENPAEGQLEWYQQEIYRIEHGDWIMINGVPTWFNRYCYQFHQWFVLQEGIYPNFKETSLEFFRFYELNEEDSGCLGECGIKGRRVGLSSMKSCIQLFIGLLENNTLQGIVSKTGRDAEEMYLMIKNGLENLPEFLIPELNKVTDSEIHIAKKQAKISKNNKTVSSDKGKNNRINWLATAENAYDSSRVRDVTIDEAAKWEKVNVQICLKKISETLVVGSSIGGHVSVFSSVNKGDKGGDNFRAIWDGSDHITGKKDKFGRTQTKLRRFFIAGYRGLNGYVGKYGESVVDTPTPEQSAYLASVIDPTTGKPACLDPKVGAREFLEESRKMAAGDPEAYQETVRMYPFDWKEVFRDANNNCHFNLEEVNNQIEKVEDIIRDLGRNPEKGENGRRGFFRKTDKQRFIDSNEGFWYILEFLPEGEDNKVVLKGSIRCPNNTQYGVAGLDTFSNARTTVDKGSDACCVIFKRYNPLDPENSGMPVALYIGRPKTKVDFHNQIFGALEYYGIKMLAERAPTDWEDYAVDESRRLASPVATKNEDGYLLTTKRANESYIYGIAPQSTQDREAHLTEMIEYALNNMHKIKFIRILRDMRNFNIKDRTDYDGAMAFGYALLGIRGKSKQISAPPRTAQIIRTYRLKTA